MILREHDNADEQHKVWLSGKEVEALLDSIDDTEHWLAVALGVRCGLRSHEILNVTPRDLAHDERLGHILRVRAGKGDQYRETPCPEEVARAIKTMADMGGVDERETILEPTTTRTLRRWVRDAAEGVDSDDEGWQHLTTHDLRRTWATQLAGAGDVDPLVVCDWGGWSDLNTFLEHYRGTYSPEVQAGEREKVGWL